MSKFKKEIKIDVTTSGEVSTIKITHMPTGFSVTYAGGDFNKAARKRLTKALKKKIKQHKINCVINECIETVRQNPGSIHFILEALKEMKGK